MSLEKRIGQIALVVGLAALVGSVIIILANIGEQEIGSKEVEIKSQGNLLQIMNVGKTRIKIDDIQVNSRPECTIWPGDDGSYAFSQKDLPNLGGFDSSDVYKPNLIKNKYNRWYSLEYLTSKDRHRLWIQQLDPSVPDSWQENTNGDYRQCLLSCNRLTDHGQEPKDDCLSAVKICRRANLVDKPRFLEVGERFIHMIYCSGKIIHVEIKTDIGRGIFSKN